MYRDLGFLRVWGGLGERAHGGGAAYAYLIYPHKPIVAYVPADRRAAERVLRRLPRPLAPYGSARLPDSDDVLAKWMALTADERRLIGEANMHLPGPPGRPRAGAPRPRAAGALGARARRARRGR